ncbi:MAG: hypothetical protein Faunusvirus22_8 [Faunusvirus sp.]|jgi:8-oxo-dGTP pyrophosphatase MutT (NUDIX family)|uniref:Nudix hydrolase domain-containing protein n=1 Tax=Faunusvirus sp. TaxID=2487766 RepID=A0A3G4ZXC4_9VIRU|nr:MAG: hypothetical protein Faunusvirus22_8 [Faunusvirus sp.]
MTKRVAGVIFIKRAFGKKYILLQHRAYYMSGGNKLALIQGSLDDGESAIQAAYRESCEETSIDKFIKFNEFQQVAKRISRGIYNCFIVDVDKLIKYNMAIRKWNPHPKHQYVGEMCMKKWKNAHVWVLRDKIKDMVTNDTTLENVKLWHLTREFLHKYWHKFT